LSGIDRRAFVGAGLAAMTGVASRAQPPRLQTLSDWLDASPEARAVGLAAAQELIRATDGAIHAWVQVAPQPPLGMGPLDGIPFGAKDIMETRGLTTEYGSPIYKGRVGTDDAAIVTALRRRGAVLMGKTHTTAFAHREPAPTRNPRNLEHTPGGSSSGSAAAVAAGMVPFALGTQTRGSVLRPASFCGVTGFKATYGLLPLDGVLPFATSLDTLGFFTHTPADMLALWGALGEPVGSDESVPLGAPDPLPTVEPAMAAAFAAALSRLRNAGVAVRALDLAPLLARIDEASDTVMTYEGARFHEQRYREHGERMAHMAELVRQGLDIPASRYEAAKRVIADGRAAVAELYRTTPVILVPAATGPAPRGLAQTGDASMNAPWTALGTPAIAIPMAATNGLPLGLQLTAAPGEDARVIRAAIRVADVLSA
jgi:Asp-tRNA(Asn)/Glu-tRNA(Gln) amidotransferase A subunit family amidase